MLVVKLGHREARDTLSRLTFLNSGQSLLIVHLVLLERHLVGQIFDFPRCQLLQVPVFVRLGWALGHSLGNQGICDNALSRSAWYPL